MRELKECDKENRLECFQWSQNLIHDDDILHEVDFADGLLHISGYAD
jgi:hypothetical protein